MIAKFLRRAALFSGIFLLSMSMVAPLAIAAPPGAAPPGGHLNITEVLVDDPDNPTSIMIHGERFLFGSPLTVTLADFGPLTIVGTPTETQIEALLPAGILPGDYLLTVSVGVLGTGQSQNDEYDLTIGAVGAQGDQGVQGKIGPKGDQGDQGVQGKKGDQGVQGKAGPDGPAGTIDLTKITQVCTAPGAPTTTVSCPAGQRAVGGGASCFVFGQSFTTPRLIDSLPTPSGGGVIATGWLATCAGDVGGSKLAAPARICVLCVGP